MIDKKLKRLFIYYVVSALGATLVISGCVLSHLYADSLSDTLSRLQTIKINGAKMKAATREIERLTARLSAMVPANYKTEEMEARTLSAVDAVTARMKNADITLGAFSVQDSEISLPIVLTGPINDYAAFVRDVDYLKSMTFPFMFIDSLSLSKVPSETTGGASFEIKGVLKIQSYRTGGAS